MANIKSAKKRILVINKKTLRNKMVKSAVKTAIKKVAVAAQAGDKAAAQLVFQQSVSEIDSIADKKIIHKNKAARHKSRLSAQIKALAA